VFINAVPNELSEPIANLISRYWIGSMLVNVQVGVGVCNISFEYLLHSFNVLFVDGSSNTCQRVRESTRFGVVEEFLKSSLRSACNTSLPI